MIGIRSSSGADDMITPAACTPHCRFRPSRPLASSTTLDASASPSTSARNSAPSLYRSCWVSNSFSSGTSLPITGGGITLVIRSPTENGRPSTLRRVLDRLLGLDGSVGHDLRDPVVAVLLGHVADDVTAAALVEVHVEVGHGDPLGVEEPLEDQPVPQRVEVGDPHRVGDHRAGARPTAGTHPDAVVLRPVDEVGDHQEVAREIHLQDDADLEVGLFLHLRRDVRTEPAVQPPLCTSLTNQLCSVSPSGSGNRGM